MNDDQAALITEQVKHAMDLLKAEVETTRAISDHRQVLNDRRLDALEEQAHDHEIRIRSTTDGVTQFKLVAGLGGGGGIIAVIAMIRSFFLGGG
jgi:hypothetical protein